jgi:hypothetical protein
LGITVVALTAKGVKLVIAEEKSRVRVPVLATIVLAAFSWKVHISGAMVLRRMTLASERRAGLTTVLVEGELTLSTVYAVVEDSAI